MKMHVETLSLSNFRNYRHARIEVDARPVVLMGANGAGKTNILEAISLLTPGKGFRRAALSDFDNMHAHATWAVAAELHGMKGPTTIGTGKDTSVETETDKRLVKIDGKMVRSQHALAEVFSTLWLTPEMDTLFIEGMSARRKFIDRLVFSFDGEHASRVNAYEQLMRDRNRLLSMPQADGAWLSAIEHKMSEAGVAIAVARKQAVEGITNAMELLTLAFPKAQIELKGEVVDTLTQGNSALIAEDVFRELLQKNRGQDAAAGRTLVGIHRMEVRVVHQQKNMPAELCSTGEQKAALVSIILAQARAGALWHGNVPVLLFDEVATHLDVTRRQALFEEIDSIGAQAWLTGTDADIFERPTWQFFKVEEGKVNLMRP